VPKNIKIIIYQRVFAFNEIDADDTELMCKGTRVIMYVYHTTHPVQLSRGFI